VQKHWDVPDEKNIAKTTLLAGKADVLTLSPIWLPDDAIENFVKLGVEHNPALRVSGAAGVLDARTTSMNPSIRCRRRRSRWTHDATDLAKLRDATLRYAKDIEDLVRGINRAPGQERGCRGAGGPRLR